MTYEHLLVGEPAHNILQITLNRPKQFNALSAQTITELNTCLFEFEQSDQAILILTGTGRFFCFGADFTEFENRNQLPALLEIFQDFILKLYYSQKITVAALNGLATGAGLDLALACDFRFATDRTKVGEAYVSMGLAPDCGGSYFLTHLVGAGQALRLLISGESIPALEAKSLGLVHDIFRSEELIPKTIDFAKRIADKPQTAVRAIKRLVKENANTDLKTALANERAAQLACFEDAEHQSIVEEFLARRKS